MHRHQFGTSSAVGTPAPAHRQRVPKEVSVLPVFWHRGGTSSAVARMRRWTWPPRSKRAVGPYLAAAGRPDSCHA